MSNSTTSSTSSTTEMSTTSAPSSTTDSTSSAVTSTTPTGSTTTDSTTTDPISSTSSSIDTASLISSISSAVSSSIISPSSTTTVEPSSTEPVSTSTISLSSQAPTTRVFTSVVVTAPTSDGQTQSPITIVVTETHDGTSVPTTSHITSSASSTTTGSPSFNTGTSNNKSGGSGGLGTAGTTAVAVVVPVAVIAILVIAGIFFLRKRKQKKAAEEARRKEVEDYGFNPNNDPTLPAVASESGHEMSEDHSSGYRGWGAAGASNRKMSTTLSGGHTQGQLSDAGSNPYPGGVSPTGGASDGNSGDALMHQRRETMNSDDVGSLGQAPLASANQPGMKRGPSNASSTYSAANHSDVSDERPPPSSLPASYEAYPNNGFGYSQHGPYGDGSYGGGNAPESGMPIVRDVSARRNTRIQQPGNYQQGNSGIAQNF